MGMRKGTTGRRRTPWDDMKEDNRTPTQRFLSNRYKAHYEERHPVLKDTGEAELINSVVPENAHTALTLRIAGLGRLATVFSDIAAKPADAHLHQLQARSSIVTRSLLASGWNTASIYSGI